MNSFLSSSFSYNPNKDYSLFEKLIIIGDDSVGKSTFISNISTPVVTNEANSEQSSKKFHHLYSRLRKQSHS